MQAKMIDSKLEPCHQHVQEYFLYITYLGIGWN